MRRQKGTGGITQRKDGLWMASYTVRDKRSGKKKKNYLYGDNKEDLEVRLSIAIGRENNKRDETPRMKDNRQRQEFKRELELLGLLKCEVCGWDGSGFSKMVEAHHIVPFKDGGQVTEANIVLLCPNHHALIHKLITFKDIGNCKDDVISAIIEYESERIFKNFTDWQMNVI